MVAGNRPVLNPNPGARELPALPRGL
jgi:hypothetical protein